MTGTGTGGSCAPGRRSRIPCILGGPTSTPAGLVCAPWDIWGGSCLGKVLLIGLKALPVTTANAGHADPHEDSSNGTGSGHDRAEGGAQHGRGGGLGHEETLSDVAASVAETVRDPRPGEQDAAREPVITPSDSLASAVVEKAKQEQREARGDAAAGAAEGLQSSAAEEDAPGEERSWLGWAQSLNPWRKSAVEQLQQGGAAGQEEVERELSAAAREMQEQAQKGKEEGSKRGWWGWLPSWGDRDGDPGENGAPLAGGVCSCYALSPFQDRAISVNICTRWQPCSGEYSRLAAGLAGLLCYKCHV